MPVLLLMYQPSANTTSSSSGAASLAPVATPAAATTTPTATTATATTSASTANTVPATAITTTTTTTIPCTAANTRPSLSTSARVSMMKQPQQGRHMAAMAAGAAIPWVEKYRPRRIKDVYHQEDAKNMLLRVLETGNMPHLLFYGPPGTGKTSCALALVRELFGREEAKNRLLELNASDDRGIKVVREKIKTYAKINVAKGKINPETKKEMPAWKVVILDEADMMTHDAQSALRRLMEAYSRTTRFIFICNYVHKIIEPIFSRCSPHRFEPIAVEAQRQRIQEVCRSEGIECPPSACNALQTLANGDLRRALTLLQAAASASSPLAAEVASPPSSSFGVSAAGGSPMMIMMSSGSPPTTIAEETLYELAGASACVEDLIAAGWDVSLLLQEMVRQVAASACLRDLQKARITTEIAAKDFAVYQGANAYLQLLSLALRINACFNCGR